MSEVTPHGETMTCPDCITSGEEQVTVDDFVAMSDEEAWDRLVDVPQLLQKIGAGAAQTGHGASSKAIRFTRRRVELAEGFVEQLRRQVEEARRQRGREGPTSGGRTSSPAPFPRVQRASRAAQTRLANRIRRALGPQKASANADRRD